MPYNEFVLSLAGKAPHVPESAYGCVVCLPGKVAVEMAPVEAKSAGGVYLPEETAEKLSADVGTVLAVGERVALQPGNVVLVRPYDGVRIQPFESGGYRTQNEVRITGIAIQDVSLDDITDGAQHGGKSTYELVPWWDSIPARIVGNEVHPNGHMLYVSRVKKAAAVFVARKEAVFEGGFQTCEFVEYEQVCQVVRAGTLTGLRSGARVAIVAEPDSWLQVGDHWLIADEFVEAAIE